MQETCPAPSPDFRLPEKEENNDRIIRYLTENRGIEKDLVEEWISSGDIYEEKKHHNVVFVGRDADGIPRYAHCRGTGEIKYRGDVAGSDKSCGFCHRGTDNQLFVFEAAIDLLSFIQLFPKDWKKRSYLSLGGISSAALMAFLSERSQITSVFLCLDNDQAGNEACEKLAEEIPDGYSVIRLKLSRKDWNEILCDKNPVYTFRKADDHSGKSGRGKDVFCHDADCRLHEPQDVSKHGRDRAFQCDLSDCRGWHGRYDQAETDRSRR